MELYFADPTKNDKFSYLRGLDLQELLVEVENFYLIYRACLDLPKEVSFGVELEYEKVFRTLVNRYISKDFDGWDSEKDASLATGGEVKSAVLHDNYESWDNLQKICHYLKERHADTFHNAAGHIHVGAHILGNDVENWKKFIKTYAVYESVLFRFLYGDKLSARSKMKKYAPPIAEQLYRFIDSRSFYWADELYDIERGLPTFERRQAINFQNVKFDDINNFKVKNTIEFRSPNATVEEVIWQNNINTLTKLMLAPKSGLIDSEWINYKLKNERISSSSYFMYNIIYLKNTLEFVDMIFDNNLDKVYFLRQYIKVFEEKYDATCCVKAKKFTK